MYLLSLAMTLQGLNQSPFYSVIYGKAKAQLAHEWSSRGYSDLDDMVDAMGTANVLNLIRTILATIMLTYPNA